MGRQTIECRNCGRVIELRARGMCDLCYSNDYYKNHKRDTRHYNCDGCGLIKNTSVRMIDGKRLCLKCTRAHSRELAEHLNDVAKLSDHKKRAKTININWLIRELTKV